MHVRAGREKKPGTSTVTTVKKGIFADNVSLCEEFDRSISRA